MIPKLRFPEFSERMNYSTVKSLSEKLNVGFVGTCEPYFTSEKEGVLLLRTGNLKGVDIDLTTVRYVTNDFHFKNEKSRVKPLDLLLARHGGKGEICLVPKDFQVANCLNIVILRVNKFYLDPYYFRYLYSTYEVQKQIYAFTAGSTQSVINTAAIAKLKVYYPSITEQKKTAVFFGIIDQKINLLTKKKEALETYKKGLMQKIFSQELRFKREGGTDYPEWERLELIEVLDYEQPTTYIVDSTEYSDDYKTPVLTAGKSFILGYTDEEHNHFTNIPVVIFDDFTTDFKYVDFEFKVKSSAMKILRPKENVNVRFVYDAMKTIRFPKGEHKRYWISEYSFMKIPYPSKDEQQKIASLSVKFDQKIDSVDKEISSTQKLKKGLLQQMFV